MTLADKIVEIYPELNGTNFIKIGIVVQNDSDGKGDYIKAWNHPTLTQPTPEQLGETQ
jgi:hypothetical protein